mgnify:CR=1 FL=1
MKTPFTGQKSLVIHRLLRIEQPCVNTGKYDKVISRVRADRQFTGSFHIHTYNITIRIPSVQVNLFNAVIINALCR